MISSSCDVTHLILRDFSSFEILKQLSNMLDLERRYILSTRSEALQASSIVLATEFCFRIRHLSNAVAILVLAIFLATFLVIALLAYAYEIFEQRYVSKRRSLTIHTKHICLNLYTSRLFVSIRTRLCRLCSKR